MSLKRRDFLKVVAGSALTLPFLDCSTKGYYSDIRKGEWVPGEEKWVRSICEACPGGCGILVRVVDGKAVKIEGDPAHPVNRGTLCPLGQAGLQLLYNPDRIKGPMKKVGERTSLKWESIDWGEALEILVSKLKELKNSGEAHQLVLLDSGRRGMLDELLDKFMRVFGSPNHINHNDDNTLIQAFYLTQGIDNLLAYDFEHSNYILSFGSSFLSSWPSPVQSMKAYSYLRQGRQGRKAKIVQIEPRLSITASRSDTWIPIEPGTEGMLALGIAYIIIKENLYDRNYVEKFTFGFEDWRDAKGEDHNGFRTLILDNYRTDVVSEITGVSVDAIVNLAKEFATNKPAVAIVDNNATNYSNGLYNALAIHSLNALVGSVDVHGGVLVKRSVPLQDLPQFAGEEMADESLLQPRIDSPDIGQFPLASSVPALFPDNVLKEKPYPVRLLILNKSNPIFSSPNSEDYRKAFEKIPFIVSFSSFMDESTQYADLILPDKTYLEKHQCIESSTVSKIAVVGIGKPVIEDLFTDKPTEDVILEIAQKMGTDFARHFPWRNSQEFLLYKIDKLSEARRGIIFTDEFEEKQLELLQERGWWVPQFASAQEFKQELLSKGGWWDPSYDYGVRSFVLQTPSRKFEFYSQFFEQKVHESLEQANENKEAEQRIDLRAFNIEAEGDDVFLPHFEQPKFEGEKRKFPLHLYIYHPIGLPNGYQANQPWFQEIMGFHLGITWDSWAEINPETAHELGIADNDLIWIESAFGKVRAQAKVYSGTMPDVLSVPYGLGHKALGQWARNRGFNPTELISTSLDELTGLAMKLSTRVRVYKV